MTTPAPERPTAEQILALPLEPGNDAGATTVRDYLTTLLAEVWRHGEGFSGKRPFGNSGWEYDLYRPLAKAGFIEASYDEDGCLDECDDKAGDALIADAITSLANPGSLSEAIAGAFAEVLPLADATVLKLEPGDILVFTVAHMLSDAEHDFMLELIEPLFPNHRCVVLENSARLAVVRPAPTKIDTAGPVEETTE